MRRILNACLVACCGLGWLVRAQAQTDEIQVYDATIAAPGTFSLDWHNNYTASGSLAAAFPGGIAANHSLNGVTEWAYGVTPWFEAGLYAPLYSVTSSGSLLYDGFKLRTLFVSPDAANRGLFYGLNLEFSFNAAHWNERRYTSEVRSIIGVHADRFDIIFNPIFDNAYRGIGQLEFVPATRVAMTVTGATKIALEEYDNFGHLGHFLPAQRQLHQLFLVLDRSTRWFGVEAGFGAGLTSGSDHRLLKLILIKDFGRGDKPQ